MAHSRRVSKARAAAKRRRRRKHPAPSPPQMRWWEWILFILALCAFFTCAFAAVAFFQHICEVSGACGRTQAAAVPFYVAGIAVGGVGFLALAGGVVWLLGGWRKKDANTQDVGKVVLLALACTALGAAVYLGVIVGVLVGLSELLPEGLLQLISAVVSIGALPFLGPIAFQLLSGREVDEYGGGAPPPGQWWRRLRRQNPQASASPQADQEQPHEEGRERSEGTPVP